MDSSGRAGGCWRQDRRETFGQILTVIASKWDDDDDSLGLLQEALHAS